MKLWRALLASLLLAVLAACGGGGGSAGSSLFSDGTGTGGGTGGGGTPTATPTATNLAIQLDKSVIATGTDDVITATVTAASGSQTLAGVEIAVTADSNAFVTQTSKVTDEAGQLKVTVSRGSDSTPRTVTITATATANGINRVAAFQVSAVAASGTASLGLSLSNTVVTAAQPTTARAVVLNSQGQPVEGVIVAFTSPGGLGTFSAATALTDSTGVASVQVFPRSSNTSGADLVVAQATVSGATVQSSKGFTLTATAVTISTFAADLVRLGPYGQTNMTVRVAGAASGTPVSMSINSLCVTKQKASIVPLTATTTNGVATFTYKDSGCGATDTLDPVQVTINGGESANLSLALTAPNVSSVGFVTAVPSTIFLKGSGLAEASVVTFEVRDEAGQALPNQDVELVPTTLAGGLTMDGGTGAVVKRSDSNGRVTVRVNSGTVPTPVRIRAAMVSNPQVVTVSSNLAVAVGLPSQLNFSFSQETINIEGFDVDGTTNTYNIIASDRLANPVPTGTTVNFVSEGGTVEPALPTQLIGGLARVSARALSSEPRPPDGRITVLAYALGEESFFDTNGDNVFTAGEAYQDLGDVFLSRRFLPDYDAIQDQFISLGISGNSACSPIDASKDPAGLLSATRVIPSKAGSCDSVWGRAYVRRALETVYSTSASRLLWGTGLPRESDNGCGKVSVPTGTRADNLTNISYFVVGAGENFYGMGGSGALSFIVADRNLNRLNPMPRGTIVDVSASDGISVAVLGGSPVANTSEATVATISYKFETASVGAITVSTRSPSGLQTSHTFGVNLDPRPLAVPACQL